MSQPASNINSTLSNMPTALHQKFLVIDDHEAILNGTLPALQNHYPNANIFTAQTFDEALRIFKASQDWNLAVVDLSIPKSKGELASPEFGIDLLKHFLNTKIAPNILVLSTDTKPIIRLKSFINGYEGGFVVMDKGQSLDEMIQMAGFALRGSVYWPKSLNYGGASPQEFDHRWIQVLKLKFENGLTDKAIASELAVSDRTIRNYWIRLQDSLCVPNDPNHDVRIQIWNTAKGWGLVD